MYENFSKIVRFVSSTPSPTNYPRIQVINTEYKRYKRWMWLSCIFTSLFTVSTSENSRTSLNFELYVKTTQIPVSLSQFQNKRMK
jgi:hypothetical protein